MSLAAPPKTAVASPYAASIAGGWEGWRQALDDLWLPGIGLALFLLTALVGVWVAYDRQAAEVRCALMAAGILMALLIALLGRRWGEPVLVLVATVCAFLAALLGAYFLLTWDWQVASGPAKFAAIQQVGLWLQAHRPAIPVPDDINANVAGGALAVLLPLGLAAFLWSLGHLPQAWPLSAVLIVSLSVALLAEILSASRGAWLGLAAAVCMTAIGSRRSFLHTLRRPYLYPILIVCLAGACLFCVWVLVEHPNWLLWLGRLPSVGDTALSRLIVWQDMLGLVGDYLFTGSGLASTNLAFSSYVLVLHVIYITHAHNLLLQVLVEQGLLGLLSFTGLFVLAGWRLLAAPVSGRAQTPAIASMVADGPGVASGLSGGNGLFRAAAACALAVVLAHGLADAGVFVSKAVPVIFIPLGLALALAPARVDRDLIGLASRHTGPLGKLLVIALCLLAAALLPVTRSAFQVNLGTVAQTRAELSIYRWPQWPIQDALRRSSKVDLQPAIARYRAALDLDPMSAAANRRLGQIELSRGDYEAARNHLGNAYHAAPWQRAGRLLLGESYALAGDVPGAAALWRSVPNVELEMAGRAWWHESIGEQSAAASLRQAAALAIQFRAGDAR